MDVFIRKVDLEVFEANKHSIEEHVEERRLQVFEPTKTEIEGVRAVLLNYARDQSRKIYGGHGHNLLLKSKDPKDAIYSDLEYKDIEWYSSDPVKDMLDCCDLLHAKGYAHVQGKEAVHPETFKIFVNFKDYCDITYAPRNVYNRIPYEEVDGLKIVSPSFSFIDSLRTISDMLSSGYRLEKVMKRGYLLQKHFAMKSISAPPLVVPDAETVQLRSAVLNWLVDRNSTVLIGQTACDYYRTLKFPSGITTASARTASPHTDLQRIDLISIKFASDAYDLYHHLKKLVKDDGKLMTIEYYPFFQFTGHRFSIWYNAAPIVQIFTYNKRCTAYRDITVDDKRFIRIGTFSLVLMYNYIMFHLARINREKADELHWRYNIQTIVSARNKYLTANKKNIYDRTPYQEFRVECIGKTVDPPREAHIRRKELHKQHRQLLQYDPEAELENERKRAERHHRDNPDQTSGFKTLAERKAEMLRYQFFNTSGNPVNKKKNLKVHLSQDTPPHSDDVSVMEAVYEDDSLGDDK